MSDPAIFGTDGVRGKVGTEPLTPDFLVRLGYALGVVLGGAGREVVIGKDTRLSGYMVESAIEAGLAAAGANIALTGPLPTSAIALLTEKESAAAGVVISASHNPYQDNGIKIFDASGRKLSDQVEMQIETIIKSSEPLTWSADPGKARRLDDATEQYIQFCLNSIENLQLKGTKIIADAANGAAYFCLPEILRRTGAEVIEVGCKPNGRNINVDCGVLCPTAARQALLQTKADLAIVVDGDADRLLVIDKAGRQLDGDACLYVLCQAAVTKGVKPEGVVGTLMSNHALSVELAKQDIQFKRAKVGDRYVAEELRSLGWQLGGEPSGHLLQLQLHSTGDGILSALSVINAIKQLGCPISEAVAGYKPLPSVLLAVETTNAVEAANNLEPIAREAEADAGVGRIVVRPSGTEPVVRILVEAVDVKSAEITAQKLAAALN